MMLMVGQKDTSRMFLNVARTGAELTITEKRGKPVTVKIPADEIGLIDAFEQKCGLQKFQAHRAPAYRQGRSGRRDSST